MANNVTDLLEKLADDELRGVIDRSNELLKQRDDARKAKALSEARALLESVGLSLKDVAAGKQKNGSGKGLVYHGGHSYQHPTDKAKIWKGTGQKPNWLRELEAQGGKAVELP
jgi:DNA-binding protein H-NS